MYDLTGRPVNIWREDVQAYVEERDRFRSGRLDPKMSPAEQRVMSAEIDYLESTAIAGKARFDGQQAKAIRNVIVRLAHHRVPVAAFGRKPRVARLYLGEPRHLDRTLLPLALATKEASEAGNEEQNETIRQAIERAREWARTVA